jgi:hypothetical protein
MFNASKIPRPRRIVSRGNCMTCLEHSHVDQRRHLISDQRRGCLLQIFPYQGTFDGNIILRDLRKPQDNPGGGIDFTALILLNNSSPSRMDFGSVVFSLAYKNVNLSIGTRIATKSPPE